MNRYGPGGNRGDPYYGGWFVQKLRQKPVALADRPVSVNNRVMENGSLNPW